MINLLPEKEKKELIMDEIWQKIFVWLIFILIFFAFLIFILFSLKLYISAKSNSLANLISQKEKELKVSGFQDYKQTIEKANEDLFKIEKLRKKQILVSPIFERLSDLTPDSIYFTDFSFQKDSRKEKSSSKEEIFAEIHISGWAETREDLFFFKNKLEAEENFKKVYFSPNSWVKPVNVEFSLSFEYE